MIPLGENTLYRQILLVLNRRLSDYRINKPVSVSTRRREMYMLFRALPMLENPNTFFLPKRFVFGFSFYVSTNRK